MIDSDLFLFLGMIVATLAIPGVVAAFADGRPPRAAALAILVGGGLILFAYFSKPGGYAPGEIPDVVLRELARVLNR